MSADFNNSVTVAVSVKLQKKVLYNLSPRLKSVAALPGKI